MKFCKQCGSELETDKKFCVSCGTPVNSSESVKSTEQPLVKPENENIHNSKPVKESAKKEPMSAQKKRTIIISSAVVGLLAIFYFVGSYFTSEERLVKSFNEAVYQQDAEKLADLLSYRNPELEISNQQTEAFMKYLEKHPEEKDYLVRAVEQQIQPRSDNEAVAGEVEAALEELMGEESSVVTLEQDGKFLIFDQYRLFVEPIYFTWETDFAGTKLYQYKEELAKASKSDFSKKLGPFLTGVYTFSSQYKNDYMDLKQEEEIELTSRNMNDTINLSIDAGFVQFGSDFDPSIPNRLIINDEAVDFNVFGEEDYGPVIFDGSMEIAVEADFPWGTLKTETVPLQDGYFEVEFSMNQKLKKELVKALNSYSVSYGEALTKNDVSLIKNMSTDLNRDFTYEAENYHGIDEGYISKKDITALEMDNSNFYLTSIDSGLMAIVYVKETVESGYYHRESEPDLNEEEIKWEYHLIYEDGKWIVSYKTGAGRSSASFKEVTDIITEPISIIGGTETGGWKEAARKNKAESKGDVEEELTILYNNYSTGMVSAINEGDYSKVEHFIQEDSTLDIAQRDLVERLSAKNIKEELHHHEITDISSKGSNYILTANETVKISYQDDTSEVVDYEWKYTAVEDGDGFKLTAIE